MTLHELKAYRLALRDKLRQLDDIEPVCMHCEHFALAPHCSKFDATPPEDFRNTPGACVEWIYDEVPF